MNERVAKLRQASLDAVPTISTERAELITDFYASAPMVSTPVLRAMAFKYLMEHKTVCINEGELIVGEKGPAPKATPTYPNCAATRCRIWKSSIRARRFRSRVSERRRRRPTQRR